MKHIDTVIFDLDGTLLDTLEDLKNAVNHALRTHEMPERTLEEVRGFVGNGVKMLMVRAVPDGEDNPKFLSVFESFKTYYKEHSNENTRPYDGIIKLLAELKEDGYAIAIVSNKIDFAVKDLNELYFKDYVKVAIGEKEGVRKKPAPDTVYEALKELGRSAETAIYVGDSDVDIDTAKAAKMKCISVGWGFRDEAFLMAHGAECYVRTPKEISDIVKGVCFM